MLLSGLVCPPEYPGRTPLEKGRGSSDRGKLTFVMVSSCFLPLGQDFGACFGSVGSVLGML
jgi:hypothetical protein